MPFTVEIAFTGLGLVVLRNKDEKRRSRCPDQVSFHMVDGQMLMQGNDHAEGHSRGSDTPQSHQLHVPRIWFRAEDLLIPAEQPFSFLTMDPEGFAVIGEDLTGKTLEFQADGGNSPFDVKWGSDPCATEPREGEEDALDWIPDIAAQVGLSSIVEPSSVAASPYVTSILLPGGEIRSRHILRTSHPQSHAGAVAKFKFGNQTPRVIAEQVIWRRKGVKQLTLDGLVNGERMTFEGSLRALEAINGSEPVLSLSLTNLPVTAISGRFARIEHFPMFQPISAPVGPGGKQTPLNPKNPLNPGPVTSGSLACPPARVELYGSVI